MKAARLLVLLIAVASGVGAVYLVRSSPEPAAPQAAARNPQLATTDVLVAAEDIGIGHSMAGPKLRWQTWPADAARSPNFIRKLDRPDAISQLTGAISRAPFSSGEPIREDKLIKANGSGYLAAVLPTGLRAISISISPETGVGGFILPNDRVDVILIRAVKTGGAEAYVSETILANVQILAIDQTIEEKNGAKVVVGKIATLALTPPQTERIALATRLGTLTLALRSLTDTGTDGEVASAKDNHIQLVRFGQTSGFSK